MNRFAPLAVAFALCACSGQLVPGDSCLHDDQCDPGDSCKGQVCQPDRADTFAGAGLTVTPAEASVHTRTGVAPQPVLLDVAAADGAAHDFAVSCAPSATATPASGRTSGSAPSRISVQPATAGVGGTHIETCTVTSGTAPSVQARIVVTAAGFPVGGGGGGGTGIGPTGGTVDLLDFVLTGDTRPSSCNNTAGYPSAIHQQIVRAMSAVNPQFGLDLGDHMYACSQNAQAAQEQMALYTQGLSTFTPLFLMTMGNHECENGADCTTRTSDVNYLAFMSALQQVSKQGAANYALQIQTRFGRVTLVVVADNYFGAAQQAWLESTLTDADSGSIATLVAKHHPVTGSRIGPPLPWSIIQNHKYSLVLTAHNHNYAHDTSALGGRSVICGLGGANASHTGFCRIQQSADGQLHFTQYDASGNPGDTWAVSPR